MGEPPHAVTPRDPEQAKEYLRRVNKAALAALEHLNLHPGADARPALWRLGDIRLCTDTAETFITGRKPEPAAWSVAGEDTAGAWAEAGTGDPR